MYILNKYIVKQRTLFELHYCNTIVKKFPYIVLHLHCLELNIVKLFYVALQWRPGQCNIYGCLILWVMWSGPGPHLLWYQCWPVLALHDTPHITHVPGAECTGDRSHAQGIAVIYFIDLSRKICEYLSRNGIVGWQVPKVNDKRQLKKRWCGVMFSLCILFFCLNKINHCNVSLMNSISIYYNLYTYHATTPFPKYLINHSINCCPNKMMTFTYVTNNCLQYKVWHYHD